MSDHGNGRGDRAYLLSIPRAKQKGATAANRAELKVRPLVSDIGRLVETLVERRKAEWAHLPVAEHDIPMFGDPGAGSTAPGLEMHPTSARLASRISAVLSRLPAASERTGGGLRASSRRLRYTKGSRMAAEGHSPVVIAETLDHSNTRTAAVYVASTPAVLERIDRAMAMSLATMAQAFQGELLEPGAEAARIGDVTSHLRRSPDEAPVGNCGSYGFCAAAAPVACYTCRHFQPWLDGPHEEMLAHLLADRDRTIRDTGDMAIASVNDWTILACAQVARMCAERKGLPDA